MLLPVKAAGSRRRRPHLFAKRRSPQSF
ncbi:hypothetical protein [Arthrobacter sp. K5]|uniref:Uncharacterized protein n=1 Tax=Arthrobacter sp. K5 TaxID=2839623 RepID=A0AAU8EVI9_9MICC